MFAPRFHSLSPALAKARRELRRPTIFNNLGPLCNPAAAAHQVIGVWAPEVLEKTAIGLSRLGTKRSWIVHGSNGIDEIALEHATHVAEIMDGQVTYSSVSAADLCSVKISGELPRNLTAEHSAGLITEIFDNKHKGSAAETIVLINAAAAIYISGKTNTLPAAFDLAKESILTGSAKAKVAAMKEATNK
jgi:anthranilate phosphoribosyltransferase